LLPVDLAKTFVSLKTKVYQASASTQGRLSHSVVAFHHHLRLPRSTTLWAFHFSEAHNAKALDHKDLSILQASISALVMKEHVGNSHFVIEIAQVRFRYVARLLQLLSAAFGKSRRKDNSEILHRYPAFGIYKIR